jgi:hypothetical protein
METGIDRIADLELLLNSDSGFADSNKDIQEG